MEVDIGVRHSKRVRWNGTGGYTSVDGVSTADPEKIARLSG
jgi:hypothetical protein